ncbi:helix-hairpin-helix domain-containing protein [bacterium]|jgi:competence protein ComEA|nr:helix-hairpin-helix domain-containing protein [bacterium]
MLKTSPVYAWLSALVVAALLGASVAEASVNVNQASRAELEAVRGIGPSMSGRIVEERQKNGPFKSPADLSKRVSGIGEKTLKKFQASGLVVPTAQRPEPPRASGPDAAQPKQRVKP